MITITPAPRGRHDVSTTAGTSACTPTHDACFVCNAVCRHQIKHASPRYAPDQGPQVHAEVSSRCRYPSLLPAGQRSFGPQPALGVGRALGLRAYFNQLKQRNAAARNQAPSSQPAAGDAMPLSQPTLTSQMSWSDSQDPQAISFSQQQQFLSCSQHQQVCEEYRICTLIMYFAACVSLCRLHEP